MCSLVNQHTPSCNNKHRCSPVNQHTQSCNNKTLLKITSEPAYTTIQKHTDVHQRTSILHHVPCNNKQQHATTCLKDMLGIPLDKKKSNYIWHPFPHISNPHPSVHPSLKFYKASPSSSILPAMLDYQPSKLGKACSLLHSFWQTPELPLGLHQAGPCLASQSIQGEAEL